MKYLVFVWAYNVILYKVEYMIVTDWVPDISSFFKASSKYVHKSHASSHDGVARVDNFFVLKTVIVHRMEFPPWTSFKI